MRQTINTGNGEAKVLCSTYPCLINSLKYNTHLNPRFLRYHMLVEIFQRVFTKPKENE